VQTRDGVLEGSRRGCSGQVDDGLGRKQSRHLVALYSKDAVLWGHAFAHGSIRSCRLRSYFVGAFQALPKLTVKFGEQFIAYMEDTAVNTGYYTLFYTKDGETKSIPPATVSRS